jgi:two-component system chemotaxis sensor kinase CheA
LSSSRQYLTLFLEEARGLLQEAESCLAALARDPAPADSSHLHRTWHSLKGMAAALDLAPLVRLAHAAEDRLPAPGQDLALHRRQQALQGEAVAAATAVLVALQSGDPLPDLDQPLKHLEAPLDAGTQSPPGAASRPIAMPSAARIPAIELDALLGEVVDLEARLAVPDLSNPKGRAGEQAADLRRGLGRLHHRLERLRHIPFSTIVPALEQLVAGDSLRLDLQATLDVRGSSHALERGTLALLAEILPHILRNALAHGIESPGTRRQAGKAACGRISILVESRRRHVDVVVEDDGRGVDTSTLMDATEASLPSHGETGEDLAALLSRPGWSTVKHAGEIAGRGMGLDAVRERLATAGGTLHICRRVPHGLQVRIQVPATLAVTRCLVARIGSFHLAVPLHGLLGLEALPPGVAPAPSALEKMLAGNAPPGQEDPVLELSMRGREGRPFRLHVHQVLGRMDTVIRTLPGIAATGAIMGTVLWQGNTPVVVLDPTGLCRLVPEEVHGPSPVLPDDPPRGACPAAG